MADRMRVTSLIGAAPGQKAGECPAVYRRQPPPASRRAARNRTRAGRKPVAPPAPSQPHILPPAQSTGSVVASGSLQTPKLSWATAKKVQVSVALPAVAKVKVHSPGLVWTP